MFSNGVASRWIDVYKRQRADMPIYLYDEGMTVSTQAAVYLNKHGFKQLYILKDGYVRWEGKTKKAKYID